MNEDDQEIPEGLTAPNLHLKQARGRWTSANFLEIQNQRDFPAAWRKLMQIIVSQIKSVATLACLKQGFYNNINWTEPKIIRSYVFIGTYQELFPKNPLRIGKMAPSGLTNIWDPLNQDHHPVTATPISLRALNTIYQLNEKDHIPRIIES